MPRSPWMAESGEAAPSAVGADLSASRYQVIRGFVGACGSPCAPTKAHRRAKSRSHPRASHPISPGPLFGHG